MAGGGIGSIWFRSGQKLAQTINSLIGFTTKGPIPYADIRAYGAVGDGVTDDSAAVQAAISTGFDVFIPRGTYFMGTTTLVVTQQNQSIFGTGLQSQLKWSATHVSDGIRIDQSRISLREFYVRKDTQLAIPNSNAIGIRTNGGTPQQVELINMRVGSEGALAHQGWGRAVKFESDIQTVRGGFLAAYGRAIDATSKRNFITVFQAQLSTEDSAQEDINITGGSGHSVHGCDLEGSAGVGIFVSDGGDATSGHGTISIDGNYFEGQAVFIDLLGSAAPGKDVRGVSIKGNFFNGGSVTLIGVRMTRVDGVSIKGNFLSGITTYGIREVTSAKNVDCGSNSNVSSTAGYVAESFISSCTAHPQAFQGRLQRDSATQISLQPYQGTIAYVGGLQVNLTGGLARAVADNTITGAGADSGSALSPSTLYYVYVSNSLASFSPESIRLSTTGPSLLNGVKMLGASGNAANWRFVGWVRTNATGANGNFADDTQSRLVVNYYNRLRKELVVRPDYVDDDAFTSITLTSATWTPLNGGTADFVEYISNGEDCQDLEASSYISPVAGANIGIGISLDSVTGPLFAAFVNSVVAASVTAVYRKTAAEGYHKSSFLAVAPAAATFFVTSDRSGAAADPCIGYLQGSVMA